MEIKNFDYIISSIDFDIVHRVKTNLDDRITRSSELSVNNEGNNTRIKFELSGGNEIDENDFLYIPETNFLFYRGIFEWCAFDLAKKSIARNERATQLPFIERRNNVVVIYDDLYAESVNLRAERLGYVLLDPPTETIDYEDRIEFICPIFGKQTLKLSKSN